MTPAVLFNGVADSQRLAGHRGLHYGDGVFRTCLIFASQCIDLERQLERLCADARVLAIEPPPAAVLVREAAGLAADAGRAVLKILLMRGGGGRGYRPASGACDRLLCRYEAPRFPMEHWERGIRACRADLRLAPQPALAGIKHLNRLEQVLASRGWPDGVEEAIVADARDRPLSGTRSNLFWVTAGVLRTPALDQCGVAGLMRDKVLESAAALALRVDVGAGSWAELEAAEEVFITNSVIGIWPLAGLEARQWAAPGPVTRSLVEQLRHPRLGPA